MAWYGQNDELVGPEMSEEAFLNADQAGIRYDHWVFTPAGHITEGNNDEYAPAAAFLGEASVDRDPTHVTYYYDPSTNDPVLGPANHAYWLSGITLRDPTTAGKLDVRSLARGYGDPPSSPSRSAITCCTAAPRPKFHTRSARSAGDRRRSSRGPTS